MKRTLLAVAVRGDSHRTINSVPMKGVAICWPSNSARITAIARTRRIPSFGRPRQATVPGSLAALVARDGRVQLRGVLSAVNGPRRVTLADGNVAYRGYEWVLKPGTVRTALRGRAAKISFHWRSIGQIRYFNARTFRPEMIGKPERGGTFLEGARSESSGEYMNFKAFSGGVPGLDRDHPESRLVQRYVRWIGSESHFEHAQALSDGGYTDLFNTTRWTLFEAKASSDDRRIREAFGQLYDYRRSFRRSPSLAVLVPSRPGSRMCDFLADFDVTAVWRLSSGNFADSAEGKLTTKLRNEYRARRGDER